MRSSQDLIILSLPFFMIYPIALLIRKHRAYLAISNLRSGCSVGYRASIPRRHTQIIVIAQKKGFRVAEVPVFWIEMKGPRTPIRRLLKDIWLHGTGILRLVWRMYVVGL